MAADSPVNHWVLVGTVLELLGGKAGSMEAGGACSLRRGAAGGGVGRDAAGGVGCAGVVAGGAPGARSRSAGLRLTFETVLPGSPMAGAWVEPTMILSASGLPVVRSGATAVAGSW